MPLVAPCLQSKCSAKELGQALQAGNDICSSFSAGKLTFSATPMPSSAMSSASASATAATTPLTQPLLSIQTSIPSNATASMSVPGSLSKSATAPTTTTTGSGGGSGTSTGAGASSTSTPANAAPTQGAAKVVGGLVAGVIGLVVAL